VVSKEFAKYAGLAGTGLQVLFLKYSRDNENQADALGVDYARAAGFNPADMAVTFAALQRMGDLSGGSSMPGFLSTHPLTPDRIAHVQAMLQPGDAALARRPEAYLRTVENVVYGDDPRQGYVENGVFYHPGLRFQFTVPSGWTVDNMPSRVTLVAADKNGGLIMRGAKSEASAEEFLRTQAAPIADAGGQLLGENRTTINGLACYERSYTVPQQSGEAVRMKLSSLKKGDWIFLFQALSPSSGYAKYDPDFGRVVASFRDLADASKINRSPKRLALVKANGTDSLQAIFKKAGLPDKAWPQFAVMNGLELSAVPAAGRLIKTVR
jgi:predicted Zn-dependent protease